MAKAGRQGLFIFYLYIATGSAMWSEWQRGNLQAYGTAHIGLEELGLLCSSFAW